jgi:type IV secretion system protein VirD4
LQAQSQLKAIYKDNCDTIIGNMDAKIFLGGSEPTTLKELSSSLGKETIDTVRPDRALSKVAKGTTP